MRTCVATGCENPVFGTDKKTKKGYCKNHQYLRTDQGWHKKGRKVQKPSKRSGQADLFDQIWASEPHHSFISNLNLDRYDKDKGSRSDLYYHLFAHVLPKGKYPELKLDKDDIVLLTPDEHHLYDAGTRVEREDYARNMETEGVVVDWQRLYDKRMELLKKMTKNV